MYTHLRWEKSNLLLVPIYIFIYICVCVIIISLSYNTLLPVRTLVFFSRFRCNSHPSRVWHNFVFPFFSHFLIIMYRVIYITIHSVPIYNIIIYAHMRLYSDDIPRAYTLLFRSTFLYISPRRCNVSFLVQYNIILYLCVRILSRTI